MASWSLRRPIVQLSKEAGMSDAGWQHPLHGKNEFTLHIHQKEWEEPLGHNRDVWQDCHLCCPVVQRAGDLRLLGLQNIPAHHYNHWVLSHEPPVPRQAKYLPDDWLRRMLPSWGVSGWTAAEHLKCITVIASDAFPSFPPFLKAEQRIRNSGERVSDRLLSLSLLKPFLGVFSNAGCAKYFRNNIQDSIFSFWIVKVDPYSAELNAEYCW